MSYSKRPLPGQATMANSEPVVVASNQTTIPVESTTLNSLVETLQELIQRLAPIAGAVANTAQLRVIGSVVVTTAPSTAVTGPITSANSIAEKAVGGIMYPEKMSNTNIAVTLANINNVSIT